MTPPPLSVHVTAGLRDRGAASATRTRLMFGFGTIGLIGLATLIQARAWMLPECGLKRLTSVPCPACGGTRSLAALGHGDWLAGLALNPLAAVAATFVVTWVGIALLAHAYRKGAITAAVEAWLGTRSWWWTIGTAIAANWVYLILVGR